MSFVKKTNCPGNPYDFERVLSLLRSKDDIAKLSDRKFSFVGSCGTDPHAGLAELFGLDGLFGPCQPE